jgi:hypothetical protein
VESELSYFWCEDRVTSAFSHFSLLPWGIWVDDESCGKI